jgi:hypothetical protein
MHDKLIIGMVVFATLGIVGFAVRQQQKRLPELRALHPSMSPVASIPASAANLGKNNASPLEFANLYKNLKPAKQECFREKLGQQRLDVMLEKGSLILSAEENGILGKCLFAGTTFTDSASSSQP